MRNLRDFGLSDVDNFLLHENASDLDRGAFFNKSSSLKSVDWLGVNDE